MPQTNQEWIWVVAALWWYRLLPGKTVDATSSPNSLFLFLSLVQLQKCGSPAHMSQAKLKSLEGRKEVRQTHTYSSCREPGLLGSETCRGDGMHTRLCLGLCDSCGPLACSSLLHAKLQAVGTLEARARRVSPEQVFVAVVPVCGQAGCHGKQREAGIMGAVLTACQGGRGTRGWSSPRPTAMFVPARSLPLV